MKKFAAIIVGALFLFSCSPKNSANKKINLLKVSENGRFLAYDNGDPFFWLGDTGWLLFLKLNRGEAEKYLSDRAEKGFNVIQVMVLHDVKAKNVYGDSALVCRDVSRPLVTPGNSFQNPEEYDYWDHVDYIIGMAAEKGIYIALVPVWGTNVKNGWVTHNQAGRYAGWLAERYKNQPNIIWLNGGDIKGSDSTLVWETIGKTIRKHDPNHLISFHPFGRAKSSMWFHNKPWLDFNMFQSGHRRYDQDDTELGYGQDNWKYIRDDYALVPVKPTFDGEPSYEGIPQGLHDPSQPYWNDDDVRRYAYWSVFAGGFGFTFGNNAVMQMNRPGDPNPDYGVKNFWYEAINDPGAGQMIYLKNLMLSKPFFERVPDQSLIAGQQGQKYDYQAATRGKDFAFVYTYNGREMEIKLGIIEGEKFNAEWYNPRNGEYTFIGNFENSGMMRFDPPGEVTDGNDWVLVLESDK